jgi:hypothetical protein
MQEELWFRCLDGVARLTSTTLQAQHAFHIAKSWLALTATVNSLASVFVLAGGYYGHGLLGAGGGAGIGRGNRAADNASSFTKAFCGRPSLAPYLPILRGLCSQHLERAAARL